LPSRPPASNPSPPLRIALESFFDCRTANDPASMSSTIPARSHDVVDSRLRFRFLNAE
jgi:hypothetical protein